MNFSRAAWLCCLPGLSDKPAAAAVSVSGIAAKKPMTCCIEAARALELRPQQNEGPCGKATRTGLCFT